MSSFEASEETYWLARSVISHLAINTVIQSFSFFSLLFSFTLQFKDVSDFHDYIHLSEISFIWNSINSTLQAGRSGDRILVGARFYARSDRLWGPPSLLYNGYRLFPRGKVRPGRAADHSPLLVPRSWKSRAIDLPNLWATTRPVTGLFYLLSIPHDLLTGQRSYTWALDVNWLHFPFVFVVQGSCNCFGKQIIQQ
jgi:hypothetical protein